jgi:hypothetical protein
VGRIVDVFQHIDNVGDDYLADHDVVLAYLHDNKTMDQTISAIRFAEPLQLTCSRLVDIFSLRVGFSLSNGCRNGEAWTYVNSDFTEGGFRARLIKAQDTIVGIKVDPPGLFEGNLDAPMVTLSEPNPNCYCYDAFQNNQPWASCLIAQTNSSYPKFKVFGKSDEGHGFHGHGFQASFALARSGSVHGLQMLNHGESYSRKPSLVVEVEMGFNMTWKESARSSGGCSCQSKTTGELLPWEECIHITRAHGSYTCVGGDHHGRPCEGSTDVLSCTGVESGICRAGKRARIYSNIHGSPERADKIKFVEQDPDWIDDPGRSQTVPLDVKGRVDLPLRGATDVVSFIKDSTTFLAMSVYVDAATNTRSTSSVLFKLSEIDFSLKAEQYQTIETQGAQSVNTWTMPWCEPYCTAGSDSYPTCSTSCTDATFVMFACERRSPLYRWHDSLKKLVYVQDIPTENATSIEAFRYDNISYVVVTQVGPLSQMRRWNGTMLLGLVDESTRMRDTAGGQSIATRSAMATLHFSAAGGHDFLLFGNHYDGLTPALLYRARVEYVRNIRSPGRVLPHYNTDTGKYFVYVASGDAAIQVFERALGDLYFNRNLSDGIADVSLEGLADMAIYGDQLYSVSSVRDGGTIYIFTLHGDGSMTERADLRVSAKGTHYGLRGVRTIWIGSQRIFTASSVDQSLTAFLRDETSGGMQYLDHVQNGERILSSFEQYTKQIPFNASTNFFLEGKFPERVGREGTGDEVSCVSYGLVHTKHLFAVAYVPKPLCNESQCTNSSLDKNSFLDEVYIYEYSSEHFVEVQSLRGPTNVSDFEFFRFQELDGAWVDFLVIVSAVGKSSVYKYDPEEAEFVFFEKLSLRLPDSSYLPPECADMGLCDQSVGLAIPGREKEKGSERVREQIILPAWSRTENRSVSARRATSFVMKGITYLAVAYWWPFSSGHGWFSIVYRWQLYGSTVLGNGKTSQGSGFEIFQVIPTEGALDVDATTVEGGECSEAPCQGVETHILVFANFGDHNHSSSCMVYKYANALNLLTGNFGTFVEIQSLSGDGISGLLTFSIGRDHFLAVAAHGKTVEAEWQNNAPSAGKGSALYKWSAETQRYKKYQSLDNVPSVALEETAALRTAATVGAIDFEFFEWDGDQYLVIAQSLCSLSLHGGCLPRDQQPKSAVLQWNSVEQRFGDLLSVTNATNIALRQEPVKDAEASHRSQALRLIAAGAVQVEAAHVSSKLILIITTRQSGAIFYDFKFKQVSGLHGPVSVTATAGTTPTIYIASPQESSIAVMRLMTSADDVGNKKLLTYQQIFVDSGEARVSLFEEGIIGLAGVYKVMIRDQELVAKSRLPQDEMRCSDNRIWALREDAFTLAGKAPLPCQELSFTISELNSNNPELFETSPTLSSDGTLHFKPAPDQHGRATFAVQLHDDGLLSDWMMFADPWNYPPGDPQDFALLERLNHGRAASNSLNFTIEVVSVNDAPMFGNISSIELVQDSGVFKSVVFAQGLYPGPKNEIADQKVSFNYDWYWIATPGYSCRERVQQDSLTRLSFENPEDTLRACQTLCDNLNGCNFISFLPSYYPCQTSSTCTYVRWHDLLTEAIIYRTPRQFFVQQPVVSLQIDPITGQNIGVVSFGIKPQARGVFKLRLFATDSGETEESKGSASVSEPVVVSFVITPRNIAPRFKLLPNVTVNASSGTHTILRFITDTTAGDGECFCGDLANCLPGEEAICQKVSFELVGVESIASAFPNSTELFQKFQVLGNVTASSRNVTFTLTEHWSGRFKVSILGRDDLEEKYGKDLNGGTNERVQTFELEVVSVNERPSFEKVEKLVIPEEQRGPNIQQQHVYFSNVRSGSGDLTLDLLYQPLFSILELSCTNPSYDDFMCDDLFAVRPSIDSEGLVSFVLKTFIFGLVRAIVLPTNSGPEPQMGFEPVEMIIEVLDLNSPPSCDYRDQILLVENRGYSRLHNFSFNISTGPEHERWQHVIHQIDIDAPDLFLSVPVVDGEGALIFETAPDRYGNAVMTVTCRDNGGVLNGGNDSSVSQQVSLRVFPIPRVFSVTPGIGSLFGGETVTVKGQHFGSVISRGYKSDIYEYLDVLIGGKSCGRTTFISDGELICESTPAGDGLKDVTVVVTDPFGSSFLTQSLTREGQLQRGFAYPSFYVVGVGYVGVGSRYEAGYEVVKPPVNHFNGTGFNAQGSASEQEPVCTPNVTNSSNSTAKCTISEAFKASQSAMNFKNVSTLKEVPETIRQKFVRDLRSWLSCNKSVPLKSAALGLNSSEIQLFCTESRDDRAAGTMDLCRTVLILNSSAMQHSTEINTFQMLKTSCQQRVQLPLQVTNPFVRAPANVDVFTLNSFQGAIRSAVSADNGVFLGGSFKASDNHKVAHVGRWANVQKDGSGSATEQCGNGLDGTVNAMDRYQGTIVMGGTFTLAILDGGSILHSGGLVAWDPASKYWVLVGRTPVPGIVSAMMATGDRLYIAGRFRHVGGKEVNNFALHSGPLSEVGGWQDVDGGVQGGHVSAITGLAQEVYVGGSFVSHAPPLLVLKDCPLSQTMCL